jgi:hypothetical protein
VKSADILGIKRENVRKTKLMSLHRTVRTRTSEACIVEYMNLRGGYQPTNNLMKDENCDLLVDSHNILNRWKNYFSQLLNVHSVSDAMQIEIKLNH